MPRGRLGPAVAPVVLLLAVAAQLAIAPAHAALFDDEEARKRIESLKGRVDQLESSVSARLGTLEATVKSQGLVELLHDVEQIKADIAKLRGQYEVLAYELEQAQKRQRDLYLDLDGRLRKIESGPAPAAAASTDTGPTAAGGAAPAPPARPGDAASEQRAYDSALEQFKSGSYPAAIASFQSFVKSYPKSPLAASGLYWVGNAQYAQRDFRAAIATQRQL